MSSETSSKTSLGEHVHAAVYNFGFVAAERYPLEKNLYRASDATMNSRTSFLIRKGTFLPLNGLCGNGRSTFHRDGPHGVTAGRPVLA